MASLRVFISSTYSDLAEIRDRVQDFISNYGYQPVSFEKNDITYYPEKSLEESCYDEVKECSMFILLIKTKFGQPSSIKSLKDIILPGEIKSVTQLEYLIAKKLGLPIFVFVHKSSLDEYNSYKDQNFPNNFVFNYLENVNHARFLRELYNDKAIRFINEFTSTDQIFNVLKKQWAGLFNKYLKDFQRFKIKESQEVYLNPFKFFFFRRNLGISQKELGIKAGLTENKIRVIEDAGLKKSRVEIEDFEKVELFKAESLADALNCSVGNIRAGLPDDFLSQYLSYYLRNKGVRHRLKKDIKSFSIFKTRAIVFDFDGTLTKSSDGLTTWEKIWVKLGYDVDECGQLHAKFSKTEITHKQWCQITEKKFRKKELSTLQLDEIADEIHLLPNTHDVLKELSDKGINLYICSGSIDYIIKRVIKNSIPLFDEIKSNKFLFDVEGKLKKIIGTRYDFEGKADFVNQVAIENQIEPYEILFIGNSLNDEWAHESGALTLCINPRLTNPDHPIFWTYSIRNLTNFKKILEFVN